MEDRARDPQEHMDRLAAAFYADARDAGWTVRQQRETERKLTASLPEGSSLGSVECRSSMCRIETKHLGVQQYMAFLHTALIDAQTQLWNAAGSAIVVHNETANGGELETVAYLAREGKELP